MSATYEAAAKDLSDASDLAGTATVNDYPVVLATVGTGRAVLALAEEIEALVEPRLPPPDPQYPR